MKPGSKAYLNFKNKFRQFGLSILILGIAFYINDFLIGPILFAIGSVFYITYTIMCGFSPTHEEPNWELVYPELALGSSGKELNEEESQKKEA